MNTLEAVSRLKEFFPDETVSVDKSCTSYSTGKNEVSYNGYVGGYEYKSGLESLEAVIAHFTTRLIMDRTFDTHFITTKCGSKYCDALNKQF